MPQQKQLLKNVDDDDDGGYDDDGIIPNVITDGRTRTVSGSGGGSASGSGCTAMPSSTKKKSTPKGMRQRRWSAATATSTNNAAANNNTNNNNARKIITTATIWTRQWRQLKQQFQQRRDVRKGRGRFFVVPAAIKVLVVVLVLFIIIYIRMLHPIVRGEIDSQWKIHSQNNLKQWIIYEPPPESLSSRSNNGNKIKNKNKRTVIATLVVSPDQSDVMPILAPSLRDKVEYAQLHGYTLVVCPISLDGSRSPHWSKLKLIWLLLMQGSESASGSVHGSGNGNGSGRGKLGGHEYEYEYEYDTVFWIDLDTVIWDKHQTIEDFLHDAGGPSNINSIRNDRLHQHQHERQQLSLIAQIDLHRNIQSLYLNDGVMIIRNTQFSKELLQNSYRKWWVVLFKGIGYFNADQDAVCLALGSSDLGLFDAMLRRMWMRMGSSSSSSSSNLRGERQQQVQQQEKDHQRHDPIVDGRGYTDEGIQLLRYGKFWSLPKDIRDDTFVVHLPGCHDGDVCTKSLLDVYKRAWRRNQYLYSHHHS